MHKCKKKKLLIYTHKYTSVKKKQVTFLHTEMHKCKNTKKNKLLTSYLHPQMHKHMNPPAYTDPLLPQLPPTLWRVNFAMKSCCRFSPPFHISGTCALALVSAGSGRVFLQNLGKHPALSSAGHITKQ